MKFPFILRRRIKHTINKAIENEKARGKIEKTKALAEQRKTLALEQEIEIADLEAQIMALDNEIEAVETRAKGVERQYYKNVKRAKMSRRISTSIKVGLDGMRGRLLEEMQTFYGIADEADKMVEGITKDEISDKRSLGQVKRHIVGNIPDKTVK